jgi:hypothetical protein
MVEFIKEHIIYRFGIPQTIWISNLLNLVKSLENRRKFKKNANSIFLDSWWGELQLLLYSLRLFPNIVGMKNRNVKNQDLCYLKIHRSYVSNFWICCVLYYG